MTNIVRYLYDWRNGAKRPVATVVATGHDKIGISLCNRNADTFNKKHGRDIAAGRASKTEPGVIAGLPWNNKGPEVHGTLIDDKGRKVAKFEALVDVTERVRDLSLRHFAKVSDEPAEGVPCFGPEENEVVNFLYPEHGTGPLQRRGGLIEEVGAVSLLVNTPDGTRRFNRRKIKDLRVV